MELRVRSLAEWPAARALIAERLGDVWPRFMWHDPVAALVYGREDELAEYVLVADDGADNPVAKLYFTPFPFDGDLAADLPPGGWDAVVLAGAGHRLGAAPPGPVASALEIGISPAYRGKGLALPLLAAMRDRARALGFRDLVAPVRPSGKHAYPAESMAAYLERTRPDGLLADPWLRVHQRLGGAVLGVAPYSMTIPGTLAQWRERTGLPFDRTGPVVVPGALAPVHCDAAAGVAVYVEPNVWVRHRL
ncbi:hypothetical protein GCM10010123_16540 [Pilimelia anulata]|uniref:N-acetyltransferase domain-containing protein n=1 Tax=Pilimelia anulata TaxID=53371 RepID=A0A8J3B8M0_9ACTN|nr:GNAT family N-acetyltransferase [Pilimelia anulata]GGJ87657.1 hypothetical protein GCM10010123_16540 [Pilimelia anulata]